jgi:hypothetical protein
VTLDLPSSPLLDVALVVEDLPLELAERVQEVQEKNPELLRQFLVYCFTRKAIFDTLATKLAR